MQCRKHFSIYEFCRLLFGIVIHQLGLEASLLLLCQKNCFINSLVLCFITKVIKFILGGHRTNASTPNWWIPKTNLYAIRVLEKKITISEKAAKVPFLIFPTKIIYKSTTKIQTNIDEGRNISERNLECIIHKKNYCNWNLKGLGNMGIID